MDMTDELCIFFIECVCIDIVLAQYLECQRRYEFLGRSGHRDFNFSARFNEFSDEIGCFIDCDAACYIDGYFLVC
ncbi:hypothetical protein SDC9_91095 [bioreactor metagenome]|uniref:Uncharacterized protein n=1 Tax=bioreactor metagenome TaxID=1076179 RepID=A0A644ZUH7_9ZZZZ